MNGKSAGEQNAHQQKVGKSRDLAEPSGEIHREVQTGNARDRPLIGRPRGGSVNIDGLINPVKVTGMVGLETPAIWPNLLVKVTRRFRPETPAIWPPSGSTGHEKAPD